MRAKAEPNRSTMARFTNRKRADRAHRYRVLAQQLDFHLSTEAMGSEVDLHVEAAKEALIAAAAALDRREIHSVGCAPSQAEVEDRARAQSGARRSD